MKLFVAGFDTETNTFAPIPTGIQGFEEGFMAHGDATSQEANYSSVQLHVWRRLAEARNWQVIESLCTYAEPGGTIVRSVYEGLRDEIPDDLKKAGPADIVLLALHGAMVAEGYDDCEGDILSKAWAILGPDAVTGAELDLHCHVSETMVRQANLLVAYKEYPHPEGFTKLGLDLSQSWIVVVKSAQHFHAGFAPMAKKILYATSADSWHCSFGKIPYTKLNRPYWPKIADPFAAA